MKKRVAQAIYWSGLGMIILSFYTIFAIFQVTYAVNSQPNPPTSVIIWTVPYINLPVGTGEAWNLAAVFMSAGGVVAGLGIVWYKVVTRQHT